MLFSSELSLGACCSTLFMDQVSPASAYHSEVANFAAFCASLPIGQALSWGWLLPQYLHVCFPGIFICIYLLWLSLCVPFTTFEFIEFFHLSEAVHDGGLVSLYLDSLCLGQHIFASYFFIFTYFCKFLDYFP